MNPIEIARVPASAAAMLEPDSLHWRKAVAREIPLAPAPVAMVAAVSPYVARGRGHGVVQKLSVKMLHNGELLSIRLSWEMEDPSPEVRDLDRFADAAAVMFPLAPGANPLTMGDSTRAVNAWYWKADREDPFDVSARGYATSQRRPGRASSLVAKGRHARGTWTVTFQRPLRVGVADTARFKPGANIQLAFAIWAGHNAERSAQKSVSAGFVEARLGL